MLSLIMNINYSISIALMNFINIIMNNDRTYPCGAMEAHQTSNLGVQSSSLCMDVIFTNKCAHVK